MENLQYGKYYHIYNRGNNSEALFRIDENYSYFLNLYDEHIQPIADTYAWALMPNHFHLLVRIRDVDVDANINLTGFENLSGLRRKDIKKVDLIETR
ncbi:MAG: hypothetical protein JXB49_03445 [Bacteroidales bacterium]|nr:hypothetical protein [Bacteroidales bacterium]